MATTAGTRSDTRFFGHPLGLVTLFGIGLALAVTTLLAPRAFRSQAMALWFLAPAAGQAITAQLVSATENLAESYVPYFGTIGGVTLGLAALFFLVAPWIQRRIVEGEEDAPAPAEH